MGGGGGGGGRELYTTTSSNIVKVEIPSPQSFLPMSYILLQREILWLRR